LYQQMFRYLVAFVYNSEKQQVIYKFTNFSTKKIKFK